MIFLYVMTYDREIVEVNMLTRILQKLSNTELQLYIKELFVIRKIN